MMVTDDEVVQNNQQRLSKAQRRETFALLREAARPVFKQLKIAVPFMLCAAILEALGPWFGKTLIDKVLAPKSADLTIVVAILIGALVTGLGSDWIRFFALRRLSGLAMRSVLLNAIYQKPPWTILAEIKNLVSEEDVRNPLSDQKIVELLKKDGIQIARRTVAKYRDMLRILPSSKRKKMF